MYEVFWYEPESYLCCWYWKKCEYDIWFTVVSLARFWAILLIMGIETCHWHKCHETVLSYNWLSWLTIYWMLWLYSILIFGLVFFYWAVAHPLWVHHFQIQVISYLQGLSLEGFGFWISKTIFSLLFYLLVHVNIQAKGFTCIWVRTHIFLCPSVDLERC